METWKIENQNLNLLSKRWNLESSKTSYNLSSHAQLPLTKEN